MRRAAEVTCECGHESCRDGCFKGCRDGSGAQERRARRQGAPYRRCESTPSQGRRYDRHAPQHTQASRRPQEVPDAIEDRAESDHEESDHAESEYEESE